MSRRVTVTVVLTALAVLAPLAVTTAVISAQAAPPAAAFVEHDGHGLVPAPAAGGSRPPATFVRDGGGSFNVPRPRKTAPMPARPNAAEQAP